MSQTMMSQIKLLKEAEHVLDALADDYADYYRRPKRSKSSSSEYLKLKDVLSYAHRISYTTFAPPEFGAGGTLHGGGALPPAPQEEQMRASQLYVFADLDVGLPKTTVKPLIEAPAVPAPGMPVELPTDLPLPPPGWKPGDPVQLPPLGLGSLSVPARTAEQQQQQRPAAAPPVFPKAPEPMQVPHVQLDILDQDDDTSDYSSDDVSDDDDD